MFAIGDLTWPGISKLIEECGEVVQVCGKLLGTRGEVARKFIAKALANGWTYVRWDWGWRNFRDSEGQYTNGHRPNGNGHWPEESPTRAEQGRDARAENERRAIEGR